MEYGLEVVVLPVSDVDKARDFYASIFLDVLNVFLFFLAIFSGGQER